MGQSKILNNISIKRKLLSITLIGALLPIVIMLVLIFTQMQAEFDEKRSVTIDSMTENMTYSLSREVEAVQNLILNYNNDSELRRILLGDIRAVDDFESRLAFDIYSDEIIDRIEIYSELNYESDYFRQLEDLTTFDWYQSKDSQMYYLNIFTDEDHIILTKSLNADDYHSNSLILIRLNKDKLVSLVEKGILDEFDVTAFLVDPKGIIIASTKYTSLPSISDIDHEAKQVSIKNIGNDFYFDGWALYILIGDGGLAYDFIEKVLLISGFVLVIVALLVVLNYRVSDTISKRLTLINETMNVKSDSDLREIREDMGTDEIAQTALAFNQMIVKLKGLIFEVKRERDKSERLLKEKTLAYNEINDNYKRISAQADQINQLVYVDSLTGLKNRLAITEHIESLLYLKEHVGIMFLDVDNFKFINDTYGHDLGDRVIHSTGKILEQFEDDYLEAGRFGGDEFLIVMSGCDAMALESKAREIREAFIPPVLIDDKKFYLTISLGLALYPEHGKTHMELIKKADLALYEAKDAGRNRTKMYYLQMDEALEDKLTFQNAIKSAFSNEEFYLEYQPYYDATSDKIVAFEALIRWKSLDYGYVNPYKLITEAENMGIIIDLGEWIFRQACIFAREISGYDYKVSINISMIQLSSHDFCERLLEIANDYNVSTDKIILEMTETVLIDSIEYGVDNVEKLRQAGFCIALDDFGTGYSSLSYLKSLPVSVLKIDKAFIDHIHEDEFDKAFVKTIIHLAEFRSLTVVAEGVEYKEQLDTLMALGCN